MIPAFYYSTALAFEDAEHWFGPHASRAIAEERCFARFADATGCWTAEGRAQPHRLDPVTADMVQPGGAIADAFDQANADTIGEDGQGGPWGWSNADVDELVARLNRTFAGWAEERGYERGWALDITAEEWTPAPNAAPAETRDRPLLKLIGGGGR